MILLFISILSLILVLITPKVRSFIFNDGFMKAFLFISITFCSIMYVVKSEYVDCRSSNVKFGKTVITVKDMEMTVLVAKTSCEIRQGLMNQKELPEHGMLFVMQYEQQVAFWMKNTLIPLSIAYINKNGVILEIIDMNVESGSDYPLYQSASSEIKYALEVNQGFFKENNINVNDLVSIESF